MSETAHAGAELPNLLTLLAELFKGNRVLEYLLRWDNIVFSLCMAVLLSSAAYFASRKQNFVPGNLQNAAELIVGGVDDFVCGIIGPKGRRFTPFIGTLFLYILGMNLMGLIPFLKSSTASWSTTLALSLCVFPYVQYTAIRELGFLGYCDHLAGQPRHRHRV